MKKFIPVLLILLCIALLTGCSCDHQWTEATCTEASRCLRCDSVEAEALGHSWQDADCVTPRTCDRCGTAEGDALGHSWTEASCTAPSTCTRCAATDGDPLEHNWTGEATLYAAPVCSVCGTEGQPLPGYLAQNGLAPNTQPWTAAEYTTCTYVRPDLDTTGAFQTSAVEIFESDATHRAKRGYEWRRIEISVTFSDNNSGYYGTNVAWARADYYQDQELNPAGKQERFAVVYQGKEYRCLATYESTVSFFSDNSSICQITCYVQVPMGYDGVVLAFHHGSIDVTGMHLHQVEDPNMLLCRLA